MAKGRYINVLNNNNNNNNNIIVAVVVVVDNVFSLYAGTISNVKASAQFLTASWRAVEVECCG